MRSFVQEGNALPLVAPSGGVIADKGYLFGAIFVVAAVTVAEGLPFTGWTEGVYKLDAATHATTQAIIQGGPVYWDDTAKRCTATAAGNVLIGAAIEAKVSTVASVKVTLLDRLAASGAAIAALALAAVTGVDGTANNAASKADVDARFATIVAKVNAIITSLAAAGINLA